MIFPVASVSRPAPGPTQPPVQWVPGVLSPGVKSGRGVTLTTHPHLVPRPRMGRSYTSSPSSAFMACSGIASPVIRVVVMFTTSLTTRQSRQTRTRVHYGCESCGHDECGWFG
jgi:hypothetical protein